MSCEIRIRGLKNIGSLDFKIPSSGVWLLTGLNGAGKSSLLACMLRMWDPIAFQKNFRAARSSKGRVDSFRDANIIYKINDQEVSYQYKNERWAPTPRKNSKLFEQMPYESISYIAADPDRIQPRQEELTSKKVKPADQLLIQYANEIFETNRFDNLRKVNVTTGISEALLIEIPFNDSRKAYYSEKNFSLGEICILKLLKAVLKQPSGSLVLIDEVELALHPKAQIKLYEVLKRLATERNLTVILSSHSVTLIKTFERNRIIFLENSNGVISAKYGCFPSYILGQLAFGEESSKDAIFCVEDDHSDFLLEAIIEKFRASNRNINDRIPQYSNIRIGGSSQVIKIVEACQRMLHDSTKRFGVLDHDVEETTAQNQIDNVPRRFLQKNGKLFKFLPVTPEVGLLEWISTDQNALNRILTKLNIPKNQVSIDLSKATQILSKSSKEKRDGSKRIIEQLFKDLQSRSGKEEAIVCRECYFLYVDNFSGDLLVKSQTLAQGLLFESI